MAVVVSVNTSERKGTPKEPTVSVELIENFGIKGDAHAGPGIQQVSFLALESYRRFETENDYTASLKHGSFSENITTEGIVLHKLPIGTRLKLNEAILEVSKIGKERPFSCGEPKLTRECVMPKEGIFAVVIKGGVLRKGDAIEIIK